MDESFFVTCGNFVVLSPKAISRYPNVEKYVLGYIKPLKGLLFFVCGENYITKYNFENSVVIMIIYFQVRITISLIKT